MQQQKNYQQENHMHMHCMPFHSDNSTVGPTRCIHHIFIIRNALYLLHTSGSSSEPSLQSFSRSHSHRLRMQRPFLHLNLSGSHGLSASSNEIKKIRRTWMICMAHKIIHSLKNCPKFRFINFMVNLFISMSISIGCLFVSGLLASFKCHYPLSEIEVMECNKWQTNNNIVAF